MTPDSVSRESLERLEKAVDRAKRKKSVQLPRGFVYRDQHDNASTPLSELLQNKGDLRVKVFLTALMMATREPHNLKLPASEMAVLLGLEDPQGKGRRRVQDTYRALATANMIAKVDSPGRTSELTVLNPDGSNEEWNSRELQHPYLSLPIELWKNGWIIKLSGRSIALFAVLRDLTASRPNDSGWADGIRKRSYGLSKDTWRRASAELKEEDLLDITREPHTVAGERRLRNVYKLKNETLSLPAYPPPGANT